MCRVVKTVSRPLDGYAPCCPPAHGQPSHNTNEIIRDILPQPSLSANRKELVQVFREKGISAQLSALLGLELSRGSSETRKLESELVKQYSLSNPQQYFDILMQNQDYSRDVRVLLENAKSHRAYLVTGFLTAVSTTWTIETTTNTANSLNVNVPLSALANVPVPGALDFGLQPRINSGTQRSREFSTAAEEIFAVSYSVVELKSQSRLLPGFGHKSPTLRHPKRAKAYHLALGDDDDSSEEIDLDSDGDIEYGKNKATSAEASVNLIGDSGDMEAVYSCQKYHRISTFEC
ncbi:hypothetical protein MW887_006712 [Aspergillus wentii]|nr:hypothetical protein MW887_006712 [Aspergillus wentii]